MATHRLLFRPGVFLICIACLNLGCTGGNSKKAVKVPKINMITPENVHGVMAPDESNVWIVGNYGVVYHTSDTGRNWEAQESGIETLLIDGQFIDDSTGWVAGLYGVIIHTDDGGATWTRQESGTDKHLFDVSFVDKDYGWAIGEWNTVLHTTDGGATWTQQTEVEDKILNNVQFIDRNTGWVVGEAGIIRKTTDGGRTWVTQMPKSFERATLEEEYSDPRPPLFSICFTDAMNGWLCGIDGTILKTTDGGDTWEVLPIVTENALFTIVITGEHGWAVGDKGACLMSEDRGQTWKVQQDLITTKLWFRDIYFSTPENGWVVGQAGTVVHTGDGGATWEFQSGLSYEMDFFQMPKALEFKGMVTE